MDFSHRRWRKHKATGANPWSASDERPSCRRQRQSVRRAPAVARIHGLSSLSTPFPVLTHGALCCHPLRGFNAFRSHGGMPNPPNSGFSEAGCGLFRHPRGDPPNFAAMPPLLPAIFPMLSESGGVAALMWGHLSEKHSFSAHRAAKPRLFALVCIPASGL